MKIGRKKQDLLGNVPYRKGNTVKNTHLYRELTEYQQAGVSLWLNGKPSNSFRIANCVREETGYMRDYHMNEDNEICGISFDRIRKENRQTEDSLI